MAAQSFIFGGDTGLSYEALQRRRAVAEAMMGGQPAPRDFGTGLTFATGKIAGALLGRQADKQEKAEREKASSVFEKALTKYSAPGGFMAGAQPPASMTPAPIETQPLPAPGGSADTARAGLADYDAKLAQSESGGDYGAVNAEGYSGKYQFGEARLQDYKAATGQDFTMEEFVANPELQEQVQAWHNSDIDGFAEKSGVPFGSEVASVPITPASFRSMAHLGGKQGALNFVQSGGEYNPADSNGTRLSDYGQRFAGAEAPQSAQAAPAPAPQGRDAVAAALDPALIEAASNPYLSPGQRKVAEVLLQQQIAAMAPPEQMTPYQREQVRLSDARLALDGRKANAEGGTEYGLTPVWGTGPDGEPILLQLGKDGKPIQPELPDGFTPNKGVDKIDGGTEWVLIDNVTRQVVARYPKNLGDAEKEKAVGRAEGEAAASATQAFQGNIDQANDALALIDAIVADPALAGITGMIQGRLPPMTQSGTDLNEKIEQLKGKSFLEAFESLKGGGAITEREGMAATKAIARLERAQSDDAYRSALFELRSILERGVRRLYEKVGKPAALPGGAEDPELDAILEKYK